MIFVYDRQLAMKYILYGLFLVLVAILSLPMAAMFPPIYVVYGAMAWFTVNSTKRAYELLTKRIILSKEGVNFYRGKIREKTLPWTVIENTSITNSRILIRVEGQFFYVSAELKNFHMMYRILSQQTELPLPKRGEVLPSRDVLEQVKDLSRLKITRDDGYAWNADGEKPGWLKEAGELEYFGDKDDSLADKMPEDMPGFKGYNTEYYEHKIQELPRPYIPQNDVKWGPPPARTGIDDSSEHQPDEPPRSQTYTEFAGVELIEELEDFGETCEMNIAGDVSATQPKAAGEQSYVKNDEETEYQYKDEDWNFDLSQPDSPKQENADEVVSQPEAVSQSKELSAPQPDAEAESKPKKSKPYKGLINRRKK